MLDELAKQSASRTTVFSPRFALSPSFLQIFMYTKIVTMQKKKKRIKKKDEKSLQRGIIIMMGKSMFLFY